MIHVSLADEPADFDRSVRSPGCKFLGACPRPSSRAFNNHPYWRRALPHLRKSYGDICAYSCHWIAPDTGAASVEHFVPKSSCPKLAYEWDNFRLVCGRFNSRKGDHRDVLDPFRLQNGMFAIVFPGLLVAPAKRLGGDLRDKACRTIERLNLNDEISISARMAYVKDYCAGHINADFMKRHAPFLFREINRQNMMEKIRVVMGENERRMRTPGHVGEGA